MVIDHKELATNDWERKRGALIRFNDTFYVEISGQIVIQYWFKKTKWVKTLPIPLYQFDYNIPPNIDAVYQSKDKYFYFIQKDKYCKRRLDDKNKVMIPLLFNLKCVHKVPEQRNVIQ